MTTRYNHLYFVGFTVISNEEDGSDVTADLLRQELERRIEQLDSDGDLAWLDACDGPNDTYEQD